ncbi:Uncharacterized protein DBV15_11199 [Temnothorax longispinosus]|uniref:Uncharacterized protein n=1 Tax=Temnothorax longispinosus TaxID=300112 RepID=A0A4S2JNK3_9HYME|nr:Uncharacterized protein DBV15_11199 [Temnothorax longispinosus]
MSTHRLRRTETAQRLATPVSTPTSGSNTTLPRPYGSHTVQPREVKPGEPLWLSELESLWKSINQIPTI